MLADLRVHIAFHAKSWRDSFTEMSFDNTTKVYPTYSKPSTRWRQSMKDLKATGEMQGRLAEVMFISCCKGCLIIKTGLWLCFTWWWVMKSVWRDGSGSWLYSLSSLPLDKEGMQFESDVHPLLSSVLQKYHMVFATWGKWGRSLLYYSCFGKNEEVGCIRGLIWPVVIYYGQKVKISRVHYTEIFCDCFTVWVSFTNVVGGKVSLQQDARMNLCFCNAW